MGPMLGKKYSSCFFVKIDRNVVFLLKSVKKGPSLPNKSVSRNVRSKEQFPASTQNTCTSTQRLHSELSVLLID